MRVLLWARARALAGSGDDADCHLLLCIVILLQDG
jgi:hypothetical protein